MAGDAARMKDATLTGHNDLSTLITDRGVTPAQMAEYLLKRRQVLLMELGQIEDILGLPRTKEPRHKK